VIARNGCTDYALTSQRTQPAQGIDPMVDKDRTEGSAKKVEGHIKEKGGRALGDRKTEAEGRGDRTLGETQNTWGKVKDKARETTGKK
jgi:uncharacterized protein YjbJ (UPF0337 family)